MSSAPMVKRLGRMIFAAAVVGGLSFGTSQLFAGNASDCPYPPYYGPCVDQAACEQLCFDLFPEHGANGHCNLADHCCICAER